jgi:hypothetical protein
MYGTSVNIIMFEMKLCYHISITAIQFNNNLTDAIITTSYGNKKDYA